MNCQGKIFAGEIFRGRWTGQGVSGRRTEKRAASHGWKLGRAGSWRNARKTGCWREGLEGTLWRQGVFRERTARAGLLQNIQRSRYLVKYPASPADEPSKSGSCRISQAGPSLQKSKTNKTFAGSFRAGLLQNIQITRSLVKDPSESRLTAKSQRHSASLRKIRQPLQKSAISHSQDQPGRPLAEDYKKSGSCRIRQGTGGLQRIARN